MRCVLGQLRVQFRLPHKQHPIGAVLGSSILIGPDEPLLFENLPLLLGDLLLQRVLFVVQSLNCRKQRQPRRTDIRRGRGRLRSNEARRPQSGQLAFQLCDLCAQPVRFAFGSLSDGFVSFLECRKEILEDLLSSCGIAMAKADRDCFRNLRIVIAQLRFDLHRLAHALNGAVHGLTGVPEVIPLDERLQIRSAGCLFSRRSHTGTQPFRIPDSLFRDDQERLGLVGAWNFAGDDQRRERRSRGK